MGICTADSIINLALCCLGYVPGLLHAWYIILKNPEPDYDCPDYNYESFPASAAASSRPDLENGRVTYYYVSSNRNQPYQSPSLRTYGTVGGPQAAPAPAPKQQRNTEGGAGENGEGGSADGGQGYAPPTYAEAVRGDNKVQTQD